MTRIPKSLNIPGSLFISLEKMYIQFFKQKKQDEWAALAKYDAEMLKQDINKKKERQRLNQQKLKEALDNQIKEKEYEKHREKEMNYQFSLIDKSVKEKQIQDDMKKKKVMKEKILKLQTDINDQVKLKKRMEKLIKKKEQQSKEMITLQYSEDVNQEALQREMKRKAEKDFLQKEMMKAQQRKLEEKLEEVMKQEKLTNEPDQFGQILDQLEEKRQNEKKNREEKIQKMMHRWDGYNVRKAQFDLNKAENDRYLYWKSVEEQKHQEKEQKNRIYKNQAKLSTINMLQKQIEIKKIKEEQEKEIDKVQGQIWKDEDENYIEGQMKVQQMGRDKNLQHKLQLKEQIELQKKRLEPIPQTQKMTFEELMQNKKTLKSINEMNLANLNKWDL